MAGKQLGRPLTGHTTRVTHVAVDKSKGRPIVVSGAGAAPFDPGEIRVWDLTTRKQIGKALTADFFGNVSAMAVAEFKGRPIAVTGGVGSGMKGMDLAAGQQLGESWHREVTRDAMAVAVGHLSGRTVAVSGHRDRALQVHDLSDGQGPFVSDIADAHDEWILGVAVGEVDGRAIAVSGSMDKTIRVWDLVTGKQMVSRSPITTTTSPLSLSAA